MTSERRGQTSTSSTKELIWAAGRSRLGLILGPGSILMVVAALLLMGATGLLPDARGAGMFCAYFAFMVVAGLHAASLIECVATLRMLRRRPLPRMVLALSIYWVALLSTICLLASGVAG